jgi:hypothetical protein
MNTTTINTANRWTVCTTLKEQGYEAISHVFHDMCNKADNVNHKLADMQRITEDNKNRWEQTSWLFYGESTVSNAASFEQAYAKYDTVEGIFVTLCNIAEIDSKLRDELVILARKGN